MELPSDLQNLYRHWNDHLLRGTQDPEGIPPEMLRFIHERMAIWQRKSSGKEPPYTADPILANYRFCNIFRVLVKQTIEFHTLLAPLRENFPLWLLNMFYCRMVAQTETIRYAGLLSFDSRENERVYEKLLSSPRPRFGVPYVFPISVIMRSDTPTRELFIARYLPEKMTRIATGIQTWQKKSVYDGVETALSIFGFNLHFLWTETLIDVAYQFPQHVDLYKRFPIGPGSAPTFEVMAADTDPSILVEQLAEKNITTILTHNGKLLRLSAENWEGIGYEFRKYTNLKKGAGRKRIYKPKETT